MMNNLQPDSNGRSRVEHDKIAARAAQLWHERGRPSGQDSEIWLEAERSLQQEADSARTERPGVAAAKPMPPGTAPVAAKAEAQDAKPTPSTKGAGRKRGGR